MQLTMKALNFALLLLCLSTAVECRDTAPAFLAATKASQKASQTKDAVQDDEDDDQEDDDAGLVEVQDGDEDDEEEGAPVDVTFYKAEMKLKLHGKKMKTARWKLLKLTRKTWCGMKCRLDKHKLQVKIDKQTKRLAKWTAVYNKADRIRKAFREKQDKKFKKQLQVR
eukprot:TRINITY_DN88_c0_g1_i1.p1 TRINITY_DN88_c0_g1~~TRINITY_DN88_c0_g1_i1.p1  ORF type:complete len:168 (+),score=46.88 TRINITY_DN88_c0_g1_i1:75-578(+)